MHMITTYYELPEDSEINSAIVEANKFDKQEVAQTLLNVQKHKSLDIQGALNTLIFLQKMHKYACLYSYMQNVLLNVNSYNKQNSRSIAA